VIRKYRNYYIVELGGEEHLCSLSNKLRKNLQYPEADASSRRRRVDNVRDISVVDPVVVGDDVRVEPGSGTSMIVERLKRRSLLSREAPSRRHLQQVIAANVDQVIVVCSAQSPPFREDLLDRILAGCEHHKLAAIVCLTKIDLGVPEGVERLLDPYPGIGYPVIRTSAVTGEGLSDLASLLAGKTSLAVGLSGTGKSSLVNALAPESALTIGDVNRRTGLGSHTTTTVSLNRLPSGGHLVDAPGLRELSLWNCEVGQVPQLFPEFQIPGSKCRFAGCSHSEEPDCGVKEALERGEIAGHRYQDFLYLLREIKKRQIRY
jgi:ribosome biogenesis GTPase